MRQRFLQFIFASAIIANSGLCYGAAYDGWKHLSGVDIAHLLDWKSDDNQTLCKGYYLEQAFNPDDSLKQNQTHVTSDKAVLSEKQPNQLIGHVKITQPHRTVTADRATQFVTKKNQRHFRLTGNVFLHEHALLAAAHQADIFPDSNNVSLKDTTFRIQISPGEQKVYDANHQLTSVKILGRNFRGNASELAQPKRNLFTLSDALITSCNPYSYFWALRASHIKLDKTTGLGSASNARLLIHGVPIFYFPYFSFPIDSRRRSGFLSPNFITSNRSGAEIQLPYYWNIAPNYDATIFPNFFSLRGLQLGTGVRYLTKRSQGQVYYSILGHDREFQRFQSSAPKKYVQPEYKNEIDRLTQLSSTRQQFIWDDATQYTPTLSSKVDINYVSDDYYLQDFGNAPVTPSSAYSELFPTTQLAQSISGNYQSKHVSISVLLQNFQTLHPVTLPQTQDQYRRTPQLNAALSYPDAFLHLNYNVNVNFTNFQNPWFEPRNILNLPSQNGPVTGGRLTTNADVGYYFSRPWGHFSSEVNWQRLSYDLSGINADIDNPVNQDPTAFRAVNVPTYAVDSGLIFARSIHFGDKQLTQTLEPRLMYLYVPYVNQDQLPIFDTSLNTALTYQQLFSHNRFQGSDRIGDTNQISVGLTSRFINADTGSDLLDLSLGQSYYFAPQRVQILPTTPANNNNSSPLIGQLTWQIGQHWNTTTALAYNLRAHAMQTANAALSYHTDNKHIASVTYSSIRNIDSKNNVSTELQQVGIGSTWALTPHWQLYGGINYNIQNNNPQTYMYGIQYNSCCWQVRVINSKTYVGLEPNGTSPIYNQQFIVQFVLNGLAELGNSNSQELLSYNIPGYTDNFGQEPLQLPTGSF